MPRNAADGPRLVVALDDLRVDLGFTQRLPLLRRWMSEFQLGLLVEALHLRGG
jgi:hypothetical protein